MAAELKIIGGAAVAGAIGAVAGNEKGKAPVMKDAREQIIIFTRYPAAGRAKTRLIPALGAAGAARLQKAMTEHVLLQAKSCAAMRGAELELRFAGAGMAAFQNWLGGGIPYVPQGRGDLGQRMERAFNAAFRAGMDQVALFGSDCPGLDARRMNESFSALRDNDLVLGPAADGGYYLIALRAPAPFLFVGVNWGTHTVRGWTLAVARAHGLKIHELDVLSDVDRPEDLIVLKRIICNIIPQKE